MPFVSIVMPTMRVGGLDIVFDGLKRQTFSDFEIIIPDGIYKYRKDIVEEKSKEYNFKVKHVEPFENPFPKNAFCRYANSGLAYADCRLVVFITDYTRLPENCLEHHVNFYVQHPEIGFMCPHKYYQLKDVNPTFENYTKKPDNAETHLYDHDQSDTHKYVNDIYSGKYKDLMWSLLSSPFNKDTYSFELDPLLGTADPKLAEPEGSIESRFFHGKNESCSLDIILKCNGWNEILDGGHAYQDSDLSDRLILKGGLKSWYNYPHNVAEIINPRPIFPYARRDRTVQDNSNIWKQQKNAGYPYENAWSLQKMNNLIKIRNSYDIMIKSTKFEV